MEIVERSECCWCGSRCKDLGGWVNGWVVQGVRVSERGHGGSLLVHTFVLGHSSDPRCVDAWELTSNDLVCMCVCGEGGGDLDVWVSTTIVYSLTIVILYGTLHRLFI